MFESTSRWLVVSILVVICCTAVFADEPVYRLQPCATRDSAALESWQQTTRVALAVLLNMDDQLAENRHDELGRSPIPLNTKVLETTEQGTLTRHLAEIDARPDRRIQVVLTIPDNAQSGKTPAVVCIHGHGGNRDIVYDTTNIYGGFPVDLAEQVMSEIKVAYRVADREESAELAVHPEGHVFDVPSGLRFFDAALKAN